MSTYDELPLTSSSSSASSDFEYCCGTNTRAAVFQSRYTTEREQTVIFPWKLKNTWTYYQQVQSLHLQCEAPPLSSDKSKVGLTKLCQWINKAPCNLYPLFGNQVSLKGSSAFEQGECCNLGSRTVCFLQGVFVEVVINAVGGDCCGSTMRVRKTDKGRHTEREKGI